MHAYRAYMIRRDGHIIYRVDIECDDDEAAKERAKLLMDGHDVELWDGARKIAEFKTAHCKTAHKAVKKAAAAASGWSVGSAVRNASGGLKRSRTASPQGAILQPKRVPAPPLGPFLIDLAAPLDLSQAGCDLKAQMSQAKIRLRMPPWMGRKHPDLSFGLPGSRETRQYRRLSNSISTTSGR